jgi:hypothetical protein
MENNNQSKKTKSFMKNTLGKVFSSKSTKVVKIDDNEARDETRNQNKEIYRG